MARTLIPTSARVDIASSTNASLTDAFQFDPPPWGFTGATGCTGPQWNFVGQSFRMDIKRLDTDASALISLTSQAGQIVVDDVTNRILHFNVSELALLPLVPGKYIYDFIMFDTSNPPIRIPLMHGEFVIEQGVTGG